MRVYKNFDEIRGKIWKTTEKIPITTVKRKNWFVLNIAEISKNVAIFEKI